MTTMILAMPTGHASEARVVYYDVVGSSAKELRRELNAKGPLSKRGMRVDGQTKWRASWKFHYARKAGGCEFTDFSSTVEGTITLPRWVATGNVSDALMTKWQRFITALRIHENGHYANGVRAAKEIEALGRSFRVAGNCSTIAEQFNAQAATIIEKYKAANAEYDRRTQHGQTEGVNFR